MSYSDSFRAELASMQTQARRGYIDYPLSAKGCTFDRLVEIRTYRGVEHLTAGPTVNQAAALLLVQKRAMSVHQLGALGRRVKKSSPEVRLCQSAVLASSRLCTRLAKFCLAGLEVHTFSRAFRCPHPPEKL